MYPHQSRQVYSMQQAGYVARPPVGMAGAQITSQTQYMQISGQQSGYPFYPNQQQVYIQQIPQQFQAGSRMTTPQYQMQVQQQSQQPTQVYTYIPQAQQTQQQTANGVYGNNQHYSQAVNIGQASQQYASQPTSAGVPGNQYQAAPTQPPPLPQTQKRERKPLPIVNPETNLAINIGGSSGGTTAEVPAAVPPPVAAATTAAPPSQHTLEVIYPQPTSSPSLAPTNANEIQAQFAAQVAARMREPSQSEGRNSQGRQLTGAELKPEAAPSSSSQSSRRSSEEVRTKKVEVSITTGKETIVPLVSEPAASTATKSVSHEHSKDSKSNGPTATTVVAESKGLSADAPSFEMRSQPVAVTNAVNTSVPAKSDSSVSAAASKPAVPETITQKSQPDTAPALTAVPKVAEVDVPAASTVLASNGAAAKSDASVVDAVVVSPAEDAKKQTADQPSNKIANQESVDTAKVASSAVDGIAKEDSGLEAETGNDEDEARDGDEEAAEEQEEKGSDPLSDIFRTRSVELKYQYKPDQWSPIYTEGKKQYDRDFLLQFQADCLGKPIGLPNIPDITLMSPIESSPLSPGIDFFTPSFAKNNYQGSRGTGGGHRAPHSGGQVARGSKQKGPPMEPARQHKVITLEKVDVQLHHTENAWKPNPLKAASAVDKAASAVDNAAEEEIYGKVRSLLNKLTPQNFKTLMGQLKEFDLSTETRLNKALDIIFEKAISEPNFSVAYAHMCKFMVEVKVPLTDKPSEMVSFRKLLLNRCQREFEKDKAEELDMERLQKEIDDSQGEEQKAKLKETKEQAEEKSRRRSLGNIRFIGELFKLKILVEAIMHDCIFKLLKNGDEESLECMCGLLRTIGKDLENEKAKSRMDTYFTRMEKIIDAKKISMRVRFMLQDIVELRKSAWVPRRADNNPKTIEQIHREAEQEAIKKQADAQAFVQEQRNKQQQAPPPRGSMGGRGAQSQLQSVAAEDDWQPAKGGRGSMEMQRPIKITKQTMADENVCLRPGGMGGGSTPKWMQGALGGRTNQAQQQTPDLDVKNKFQALGEVLTDSGRGGSQGRPSTPQGREDMRGGSSSPYPSRGSAARGGSAQGSMERESAVSAVRNVTSSSAARTGAVEKRLDTAAAAEAQRKAAAAPASTATKILSEDGMKKEAKLILEEHLHNLDMKESMRCLYELGPVDLLYLVVSLVFTDGLEKSETARHQGGQLLSSALQSHVIPLSQFIKGLSDALHFWEDMEIDIPKFWLYLSQSVSPSVEDAALPLSALMEVCQPLLDSGKAAIFIAEILHSATCRLGLDQVRELWLKSGMRWEDLLKPSKGNVQEFLKEHKLEFTVSEVPLSPGPGKQPASVGDLSPLFSDVTNENDTIFAWIETRVAPEERSRPAFVRDLTTALCTAAIKGGENGNVDSELIKKRSPILHKYLNDKMLELQALYALQALVHRRDHPQGMLGAFFQTLYDSNVISDDAFIQWDKSEDSAERNGSGVAKKSVVQFITWLQEVDDEAAEG